MNWEVVFTNRALKDRKRLEKKDRKRVSGALLRMQENPFAGDRSALSGYENIYRLRIGPWRIFYTLDYQDKTVYILHIRRRGSKTYSDF